MVVVILDLFWDGHDCVIGELLAIDGMSLFHHVISFHFCIECVEPLLFGSVFAVVVEVEILIQLLALSN